MNTTVPNYLKSLAALYEERNKLYGDNYKLIGAAFVAMFPEGLTLKTPSDFNRFAIFAQLLGKLTRYGQNFARGGHQDSLDDLAVYSQMLRELDSGEKIQPAQGDRVPNNEDYDACGFKLDQCLAQPTQQPIHKIPSPFDLSDGNLKALQGRYR